MPAWWLTGRAFESILALLKHEWEVDLMASQQSSAILLHHSDFYCPFSGLLFRPLAQFLCKNKKNASIGILSHVQHIHCSLEDRSHIPVGTQENTAQLPLKYTLNFPNFITLQPHHKTNTKVVSNWEVDRTLHKVLI